MRVHRLDVVSRVTIHLFLMQVVLAAVIASLGPNGFRQTFAALLAVYAAIQALFAATARPAPTQHALTEWDGVFWLLFLAMAAAIL